MIAPTDQEKNSIIKCLNELDCCSRCILRYLGVKIPSEIYRSPEEYFNTLRRDDEEQTHSDLHFKKFKRNPCRICLDIFQDITLERFSEGVLSTNIKEYQYSDFNTFVSFPKSILIRAHSIFIYLKEKFPNIYRNINDLENLNKIFRVSSSEIISQKINKIYYSKSNFILLFEIGYEDDEMEIQNIKKLYYLKKVQQQDLSRNVITDILNKCEDQLFKEQFLVPPDIPVKETIIVDVQCSAQPLWIGGRYLKFSRDMGQTPWIINNHAMTQYSLQDIIFESIEKILGYDKKKLTFCASGREDADVRMLGNGRPFYIQIDDPKDRRITFEQYRSIEMEIFKTKLAAVIKLQEVQKLAIRKIKDGEQHKQKHYLALCNVIGFDIDGVVKQINAFNSEPLEVYQKTPLRVLHRRTQAIRPKVIYSMEAKIVPGHSDLIEVRLVTQAGTYVKEFVCSDFERTQPSLSSILKFPIDVVALDVIKIDLIWPEEVEESII